MLIDYHIHTPLCNHASGTPMQYIEAAIKKGIKEIGFAEHSPWMIQGSSKMAPSYDELEWYFSDVAELQEMFNDKGEITVRLGIEMDYHPSMLESIEKFAARDDLDFIIGSIHYLGHWTFDVFDHGRLFATLGVRGAYEDYFNKTINLIETGLFDVVGHIDFIKSEGTRPKEGYRDLMERVAEALAKSNMVVELNTAGFDRPAQEPYPDLEFLTVLKQHGVPVTLSSDAHQPEHLGRYFDEAFRMLKFAGYTHLTTFDKRKRIPVPIE
jgi:histidinol-phosphatase (PHP family)